MNKKIGICQRCGVSLNEKSAGRNLCSLCEEKEVVKCCTCGTAYDLCDIWDIGGKKYCSLCAEKKSSAKHFNKKATEITEKDDAFDAVDAADIDLLIDPLPQDVEYCEDHIRRKVNNAAVAAYIISKRTDEPPRLYKKDERQIDWGRLDEAEDDADTDFV